MLVRKGLSCYNVPVGRRALPTVPPASIYRRREEIYMSDYELLMVVLTFLSLLIAVDLKNRK